MRQYLINTTTKIESGQLFSACIDDKIFLPFIPNMIKVGEQTNNIVSVFR